MNETCLHTLECVIPYLTPDQVLEVLQINVAVLITSETSVIPNINGKYNQNIKAKRKKTYSDLLCARHRHNA